MVKAVHPSQHTTYDLSQEQQLLALTQRRCGVDLLALNNDHADAAIRVAQIHHAAPGPHSDLTSDVVRAGFFWDEQRCISQYTADEKRHTSVVFAWVNCKQGVGHLATIPLKDGLTQIHREVQGFFISVTQHVTSVVGLQSSAVASLTDSVA